jgi:hypothetical protein
VIGVDGLLASLNESSENNKDRRIHVRGDKSVAYGRIVEAMGIINAAGYAKVALVSETPPRKRADGARIVPGVLGASFSPRATMDQ